MLVLEAWRFGNDNNCYFLKENKRFANGGFAPKFARASYLVER